MESQPANNEEYGDEEGVYGDEEDDQEVQKTSGVMTTDSKQKKVQVF